MRGRFIIIGLSVCVYLHIILMLLANEIDTITIHDLTWTVACTIILC